MGTVEEVDFKRVPNSGGGWREVQHQFERKALMRTQVLHRKPATLQTRRRHNELAWTGLELDIVALKRLSATVLALDGVVHIRAVGHGGQTVDVQGDLPAIDAVASRMKRRGVSASYSCARNDNSQRKYDEGCTPPLVDTHRASPFRGCSRFGLKRIAFETREVSLKAYASLTIEPLGNLSNTTNRGRNQLLVLISYLSPHRALLTKSTNSLLWYLMVVKEALHDIPKELFSSNALTDLKDAPRLGKLTHPQQQYLELAASPLAQLANAVRLAEIREAHDNFSVTAVDLGIGAKRFGFSLVMWYSKMITAAGKLDVDDQAAWEWLRGLDEDEIHSAAENYMIIDHAARDEIPETEMPLTPEIEAVRWDFPALAGFSEVLRKKLKTSRLGKPEEIRDVSHGAMIGPVVLNSLLHNQGDKLPVHPAP